MQNGSDLLFYVRNFKFYIKCRQNVLMLEHLRESGQFFETQNYSFLGFKHNAFYKSEKLVTGSMNKNRRLEDAEFTNHFYLTKLTCIT